MNNDKPTNIQIRTLYAPGFSSLMLSYFKTNLVLSFAPYIGKDNRGFDEYCKKSFLSTSINIEGAAFFYKQASRIIDCRHSEELVEIDFPCNKGASLIFEYKPDENNQMSAFLTINKNNQAIKFRFSTTEYQDNVDGQWVTNIMQTGLVTFALILGCYLAGKAANSHIGGFYSDALEMAQEQDRQEWEQEMFNAAKNNNQ